MPSFCAVVGCGSRGNRDRNSFFRIPCIPIKGQPEMIALKTERRMKWILALRRKDLTETKLKYASICDRHFMSGRPAAIRDIYNPDWVPNQNMGYDTSKFRNPTTNRAIVCYLTPSNSQPEQKESSGSEVIDEDETSQSRDEYSLDRQKDQNEKQEENKDALISYIKAQYLEETQDEETQSESSDMEENSSLGQPADTPDIYNPDWLPSHNMLCGTSNNKTTNRAIVCYLTPSNSQHGQKESSVSEVIDEDEDTKSGDEDSLGLQRDQNEKQESNKDALVSYIKAQYLEETQEERTQHKKTDKEEDSSLGRSLTCTQEKQTVGEIADGSRDS